LERDPKGIALTADNADQRIGIIVVAYNAAATLAATLERIPHDFRHRITEVIVCDDASQDNTFELGQEWASRPDSPPTRVIRHTKNLGYGGNQKAAYALAIASGLDIVVLLHGDGQYAPECLPDMVAPFAEGSDSVVAVFGSRMLIDGAARRGGMPLYKRLGNRVLTRFENRMLGTTLSEFHSGYRAYSTKVLRQIPFAANSDDFDFDTQIIAQVVHAGGSIVEVPIPTYYGDEICYVNGMKYARDVVKDVLQYRLAVRGFGTAEWIAKPDEYSFKEGDGTSHAEILNMLEGLPASRILDVGCSSGLLAEKMRADGHYVVGIDSVEVPGVKDRVDEFHLADLDTGLPEEIGAGFDVVVAGDVIEHLAKPGVALRALSGVLGPRGQLLLSVPNFSHWYPRGRVMLGAFGYDRRGILDDTHLRFFTRATLRRIVRESGLDIVEERATGLPFGVVTGNGEQKSLVRRVDHALVELRPTLFGYQNVFRLTPHAEEMIEVLPIRV
jgi:2-polyprenyl-3-methyl-5-hydroxy-6-metoxy-1,4-benzoquinol methylase